MNIPNAAETKKVISHLPKKIFESLPYWIAAAAVALISAFYMKVFSAAEEWSIEHVTSYYIFILPMIGLVGSFWLAYFFSKESGGTGIPQVIAASELANTPTRFMDRLLGLRVLIIKPIASTFCVFFGGVTGREGPTLHISASVFYLVTKYWPKRFPTPSLPSMVIAGGAAGLAAAFNTPLGGIAFAIEELSKLHVSHTRTMIFHAVIISGIISQAILGNYLYLGTIQTAMHSSSCIWQTILLATVIGAIAGLFSKLLCVVSKWNMNRNFLQKTVFAVICAISLSLVIYLCGPTTLGSGKSIIIGLVNQTVTPTWQLAVGRILANFFTFSAGVVGGVFAPSLASGAALAHLISTTFDFSNQHLMIMVGMVAFLTGVSRAPLTTFILVIEMSNSHDSIMYLILSALIANSVSKLILPVSFYEQIAHIFIAKSKVESATNEQ